MADASFTRLATSVISTLRSPALAGGKIGARVTHLQSVKVLPIMPSLGKGDEAVTMRAGIDGQFIERWETFTQNHTHIDSGATVTQIPDIKNGDWIVDGSTTYLVKYVGNWPTTNVLNSFLHIVLEENKS